MRRLVVDAGVAIKWYIPEPLSQVAVALLDAAGAAGTRILAPDLIVPEIGSLLRHKLARGELVATEARLIAETLYRASPFELRDSSHLLPSALELVLALDLTIYDSLYLALALNTEAVLVTADDDLMATVADTPLRRAVRHLRDRRPWE